MKEFTIILKTLKEDNKRLRYIRKEYRNLTNNRVEEIFDLRKELNIRSIKETSKKYIDSNEETY